MNLLSPSATSSRLRTSAVLPALALALAVGFTGCYHTSGFTKPNILAAEVPEQGGDRLPGLKSAAGPGDYTICNDLVGLAVDGTPFGEPQGTTIGGAMSGGSVVDIGPFVLNSSFQRISQEGDLLERLTPVVNQDPDLPIVFSRIEPANEGTQSRLVMRGQVYDPQGKISGAVRQADGRLQDVEVNHSITLQSLERKFLLETTLTNRSANAVGIRNIGDALIQQGGGFKLNVPATQTAGGQPLTSRWGVDIPGAAFNPDQCVIAPMVGLGAPESSGITTEFHTSLGIQAADFSPLLVSSEPQEGLKEIRPVFPKRAVVGGKAQATLAPGASVTYRRWIYLVGGGRTSSYDTYLKTQYLMQYNSETVGGGPYSFTLETSQASAVFNLMCYDRLLEQKQPYAFVNLATFGPTSRYGYLPGQYRIERKDGSNWVLERTESWEPLADPNLAQGSYAFTLLLPEGQYRVVVTDALGRSLSEEQFHDTYLANNRTNMLMPLMAKYDTPFWVPASDYLFPGRDEVVTPSGTLTRPVEGILYLGSRAVDASVTDGTAIHYPARFTIQGLEGMADPVVRRFRATTGFYDVAYKQKGIPDSYMGAYQFTGGNTVFGVNFSSAARVPLPLQLPTTKYRVYASRGPLSYLDTADATFDLMHEATSRSLVSFDKGHPAGWVSFDVPGPSMASTGGLHPMEKLSSALAEGVNVIGYAEEDSYSNVEAIRNDFRFEYDNLAVAETTRQAIGQDPLLVAARTTRLPAYGTATTLFTPAVDPLKRRNGARLPIGWTLGDFMGQGGGTYHIVHQPRGPEGLFTKQGFDPKVPLGQGVNAWWNTVSPLSLGKSYGSFDALELLCAASFDPAKPGTWWAEFLQLRQDWFAILNQQGPTSFTKALGLSSAKFSMDTPVGMARTYVKVTGLAQDKLDLLKTALTSGAAVASTGPLLDVTVNGKGCGELATGATAAVNLTLYASSWVPVDEVRIVVNGQVVKTLTMANFTQDGTDLRKWTASVNLPFTKDCWVVVEAGAPLGTTGDYRPNTPWNKVMKGIYPVAVANPVFVDVDGGGYKAPGL